MKRYCFFADGGRHNNTRSESLSEEMEDEGESDGILASILDVLKQAHKLFFDPVSVTAYLHNNLCEILAEIFMEKHCTC